MKERPDRLEGNKETLRKSVKLITEWGEATVRIRELHHKMCVVSVFHLTSLFNR